MNIDMMKLWKTSTQIMEGIKNSIIRDNYIEYVASQRAVICNDCDKFDGEGKSCMFPGSQPCCSSCGCSLYIKVRSLSSDCPENKWHKLIDKEDEIRLDDL